MSEKRIEMLQKLEEDAEKVRENMLKNIKDIIDNKEKIKKQQEAFLEKKV